MLKHSHFPVGNTFCHSPYSLVLSSFTYFPFLTFTPFLVHTAPPFLFCSFYKSSGTQLSALELPQSDAWVCMFFPMNTSKKRNKKKQRWLNFLSLRWDSCSLAVAFHFLWQFHSSQFSALIIACLSLPGVFWPSGQMYMSPGSQAATHCHGYWLMVMSGRVYFRELK